MLPLIIHSQQIGSKHIFKIIQFTFSLVFRIDEFVILFGIFLSSFLNQLFNIFFDFFHMFKIILVFWIFFQLFDKFFFHFCQLSIFFFNIQIYFFVFFIFFFVPLFFRTFFYATLMRNGSQKSLNCLHNEIENVKMSHSV